MRRPRDVLAGAIWGLIGLALVLGYLYGWPVVMGWLGW